MPHFAVLVHILQLLNEIEHLLLFRTQIFQLGLQQQLFGDYS